MKPLLERLQSKKKKPQISSAIQSIITNNITKLTASTIHSNGTHQPMQHIMGHCKDLLLLKLLQSKGT
jgi:hypothetical protein